MILVSSVWCLIKVHMNSDGLQHMASITYVFASVSWVSICNCFGNTIEIVFFYRNSYNIGDGHNSATHWHMRPKEGFDETTFVS